VGGIPPRPSVPPERSGGGQSGFSAKWVLTFSNKHHQSPLRGGKSKIQASIFKGNSKLKVLNLS
jgi:hypothetical protein